MKSTLSSSQEKKRARRFGIAIVGGSGYGAGELLRMLAHHPEIEVCSVTSRSHAGKPVEQVHTHLSGTTRLSFDSVPDIGRLAGYEGAAVVLAMPTGQAVPALKELLGTGLPDTVRIVDLSGDLRLSDPEQHGRFYPEVSFEPELRSRFVYGLTELSRAAIQAARFVSNPGCLSSAAILALAPIAPLGRLGGVVVDAKTGTSGAGREPQPTMHHPGRASDCTAYKVLQHRHEPEILQALGPTFEPNSFVFVPHLLPVSRGILVSAYLTLAEPSSTGELAARYGDFYRQSHFIRMRSSPPRLADVVGTNFCDIAVTVRGRQAVVMSAIDNLGKGMAGAAIQNINLMLGLPEELGLMLPAIGPV